MERIDFNNIADFLNAVKCGDIDEKTLKIKIDESNGDISFFKIIREASGDDEVEILVNGENNAFAFFEVFFPKATIDFRF